MPESDGDAIDCVERLRRRGARAIVFVSSTFWWLDHYPGFARHLRRHYRCAEATDHVLVFDLGQRAAEP
jgi:hypothetical protein